MSPSRPVALSEADEELLAVLGRRIRILSVEQAARLYGRDDDVRHTERRLRRLEQAGLVHVEQFLARPVEHLTAPLSTWQPGLPPPDLGGVARTCHARFSAPAAALDCVIASKAARYRVARPEGRPSRMSEVTHDLHLSEVYLRMREELPTRARSWLPEDALKHHGREGDKVPDAIVKDGLYKTAIELVGSSYRTEKLEAFHGYCAEHELGYELW